MSKPRRRFRLLKFLGGGIGLLLLVSIIPLIGALWHCQVFSDVPPPADSRTAESLELTADLADYYRREDQTYLTVPEWYIVFHADEYAAFLGAGNKPSQFPYFRAIDQYWRTYFRVCGVTGGQYPFNGEYQVILSVISVSFTVETVLRGVYENTIGRVSEWLSSDDLTAEDAFAQQVAAEYGTFLHTIPWFNFPFDEKFKILWTEIDLTGPNLIRKWERKLILSFEYGVKYLYGSLIRMGREASFEPIRYETQFWAEGVSEAIVAQEPELRVVKPVAGQTAIAALPRYEQFSQIVPRLAKQGISFIEIAGNDEIVVSVIVPEDQAYTPPDSTILLSMPVLSEPGFTRHVVQVPVPSLHLVLNDLAGQKLRLEHVYDY